MHILSILRRKPLNPPNLPNTLIEGHSQAVLVQGGSRVLMSSQVGVDNTGELAGPELPEQTEAALDNIERLLSSLGGDLLRVVMLRIYLAESARYDQQVVMEALKHRFPIAPPAATWLIVYGLAEPEWLIAIEAEAVLPGFALNS
ncbi:RidA family protein [Vreelandella sulfidaeris]|uniref:RidA family protein n=1 Tax=Vreelandella sulfidaeris TaxID=115553 RepID=A0A365TST5_9GAMM|nr:Rid family hydrolase [Halomonas sulfidaeris]RBI68779.1 RidA family protein [Halomonas sulfidaeris]